MPDSPLPLLAAREDRRCGTAGPSHDLGDDDLDAPADSFRSGSREVRAPLLERLTAHVPVVRA